MVPSMRATVIILCFLSVYGVIRQRFMAMSTVEVMQVNKQINPISAIKVVDTGTFRIKKLKEGDSIDGHARRQTVLYIPGLDGRGDYSQQSFIELANNNYDVYVVNLQPNDRSNFLELANLISNSIHDDVTLVGESMGALLASYIATKDKVNEKIKQLVLINPATSYDRSLWPILTPALTRSGSLYPVLSRLALLTTIEPKQFQRIGSGIIGRIKSIDDANNEIKRLLDANEAIGSILPQETLQFRVENILAKGNFYMDTKKYKRIFSNTLILIGNNDRLLPSKEEGSRLRKLLSNAASVQVKSFDTGHAILDGTVNLYEEIQANIKYIEQLNNPLYYVNSTYPSAADLADFDSRYGNIIKGFSPIFLSKTENGSIVEGVTTLPTARDIDGPVLFVGNHQLFGADLGIIIKKFIDEKEVLLRGLAHPILFVNGTGGDSQLLNQFVKFGAVPVSSLTYLELLKRKENILLFPGGVSEAYQSTKQGDKYSLFWPEKIDFIRFAAAYNATIIPFSAIGMADSVEMVLDKDDIIKLPIIGEEVLNNVNVMKQARANGNETFLAPVVVPKLPSRNYFLFHKPYNTQDLNMYDKAKCREVYTQIKNDVSQGITELIDIREKDPYGQDFLKRVTYELVNRKQAPWVNE